jgi:hypothetical protein
MIDGNNTLRILKVLYNCPIVKRPCRITMHAYDRLIATALIDVVHTMSPDGQVMGTERIFGLP